MVLKERIVCGKSLCATFPTTNCDDVIEGERKKRQHMNFELFLKRREKTRITTRK